MSNMMHKLIVIDIHSTRTEWGKSKVAVSITSCNNVPVLMWMSGLRCRGGLSIVVCWRLWGVWTAWLPCIRHMTWHDTMTMGTVSSRWKPSTDFAWCRSPQTSLPPLEASSCNPFTFLVGWTLSSPVKTQPLASIGACVAFPSLRPWQRRLWRSSLLSDYDGLCCPAVSSSARQVRGLGSHAEAEAAALEIAFALRDVESSHLGGRVVGSSGMRPRDRCGSWSRISEVLLRVVGYSLRSLGWQSRRLV